VTIGQGASVAGRPARGAFPVARARLPAAPLRRRSRAGVSLEGAVVGLTVAALVALGTLSPDLLNAWHIHYISAGGAPYEKIHPATYLTCAAFLLLLFRGGDAIGELDRIISDSKLLLVYFFACALLAFQCIVLDRPVTGAIDTFLLPALLSIIVWSLTPRQRKPMIVAVHVVIWTNIALGFYEYFSGHRLVPITLGELEVTDWRSTALLGHPLSAAGIVGMYTMALALRPRSQSPSLWVIPALFVAVGSLMAFGGRTALVAVMVVFAGCALVQGGRLILGARVRLSAVILAICLLMLAAAAASVLLSAGTFDSMIDRFSSDNGSASARIATLHFLSWFDWKELLLGTSPGRSGSLQTLMGLEYGIESFWIASIVQYGLIQTTLLTIGLACFFIEVLRRSTPGALVLVLFICLMAATSVSFSSKNITLAVYVALIALLLPRGKAGSSDRRHVVSMAAVPTIR
jgi:hypothetical protein